LALGSFASFFVCADASGHMPLICLPVHDS
jgi:hypothetical protein